MKITDSYNFSYETKKEICNYYIQNPENTIYVISAFLNNIGAFILNDGKKEYEFVTSYIDVIKLFKSFFNEEEELFIFISNQKTLKYNSTKYKVIVSPKNKEIIDDLTKINFNTNSQNESDIEKNDAIKSAIIAGFFLSSGSVSNPLLNSNYHLEFRTQNETVLEIISNILDDLNIGYSKIFHHKKQAIYIKKLQGISDVLKLLNAHNNMFILEEHRISSDFVNTCQRLNNLDISNAAKVLNAYEELTKVIIGVKKTREYYQLNDNIKKYCEIVLENEMLSMSELVEIMNEKIDKPITKSWINHTNIKLREIYKKYNN